MGRQNAIKALRTTRANLNAQAVANGLLAGEFYYVTDESVLAIGAGIGTYFDVVGPTTGAKAIVVGTGETANLPVGLTILASGHATSRRAALQFGDWTIGQDYSANGTKDMYLYSGANKRLGFDTAGAMDLPAGQVAFPVTQNPSSGANVLDDYEEGATTPTPVSVGGTLTATSSSLRYTKVGRLVTVHGLVTITTVGTGTGGINVAMPFAAGAPAGGCGREVVVTGKGISASMAAASANLFFLYADGTSIIAAGAAVAFSVQYSV